MSWAYIRNDGFIATRDSTAHRPIFCAWTGERHFYTLDHTQWRRLDPTWERLDPVGYVAKRRLEGHVPLYRLVHARTGDQIFTIDAEERRGGYVKDSQPVGYVSETRNPGHRPLYRTFEPELEDHFFTSHVGEVDAWGPVLTASRLLEVVREAIRPVNYYCKIYYSDDHYYCPSEAVMKSLLADPKMRRLKYTEEVLDCDDFAHMLKAVAIENVYDSGARSYPYAVAVVSGWKPNHALNIAVLSDGGEPVVRLIEPQTRQMSKPKKSFQDELYLMIF